MAQTQIDVGRSRTRWIWLVSVAGTVLALLFWVAGTRCGRTRCPERDGNVINPT